MLICDKVLQKTVEQRKARHTHVKCFSRKKSHSIIFRLKYRIISLIFNTLAKWDFSKKRREKYHQSIIKWGEVSSKSGLVLEKHAEICLKYAWKKNKKPMLMGGGKRYNSRNISSNSSLDTDIWMLSSSTSLMRLTSLKSNLSNCLVFQFYKIHSVYFSGL